MRSVHAALGRHGLSGLPGWRRNLNRIDWYQFTRQSSQIGNAGVLMCGDQSTQIAGSQIRAGMQDEWSARWMNGSVGPGTAANPASHQVRLVLEIRSGDHHVGSSAFFAQVHAAPLQMPDGTVVMADRPAENSHVQRFSFRVANREFARQIPVSRTFEIGATGKPHPLTFTRF